MCAIPAYWMPAAGRATSHGGWPGAARVTGVEPSDGFYRYAVQREQAEQLGIHYVQADLSTWEPPASTFETVCANMGLMDIPDYAPALRKCILALQPLGRLIFSILHPCFE